MFKIFKKEGSSKDRKSSDKEESILLELTPEDLVERIATLLREYRSVSGISEDINMNKEREEGEKRACIGDVSKL